MTLDVWISLYRSQLPHVYLSYPFNERMHKAKSWKNISNDRDVNHSERIITTCVGIYKHIAYSHILCWYALPTWSEAFINSHWNSDEGGDESTWAEWLPVMHEWPTMGLDWGSFQFLQLILLSQGLPSPSKPLGVPGHPHPVLCHFN